jgi:hypothetical protein
MLVFRHTILIKWTVLFYVLCSSLVKAWDTPVYHEEQEYSKWHCMNAIFKVLLDSEDREKYALKLRFCWYLWNCWPSLFKLSFHNSTNINTGNMLWNTYMCIPYICNAMLKHTRKKLYLYMPYTLYRRCYAKKSILSGNRVFLFLENN